MLLAESLLGSSSVAANYIEDVFSTYLYTGTGASQTITNGVDLSTKGGMVWIKSRSDMTDNFLFDTARGTTKEINSNTSNAEFTLANSLTAFNTNGFTVNSAAGIGVNASTYASWTFRKQAKFFDVVTYTGTGANQTIAHNLGSVPGCIFVKRLNASSNWQVYHRSLANTEYMVLNTGSVKATGTTRWNSTTPTSTVFSIGTDASVNVGGAPYVAYLFAHNAGGFGLTGADNVISCGSYMGNGSTTGPTITLGYQPQWLLIKNINVGTNWVLFDEARGFPMAGFDQGTLLPNGNNAEIVDTQFQTQPLSNGFQPATTSGAVNNIDENYIYIAIRRGPMKAPTTGTSVFKPITKTGSAPTASLSEIGFQFDAVFSSTTGGDYGGNGPTSNRLAAKLPGIGPISSKNMQTHSTNAESSTSEIKWDNSTFSVSTGWGSTKFIWYFLRRAPGFFDIVCYKGTGTSGATVNHNLGTSPQLVITKNRDFLYGENWVVHYNNGSSIVGGYLNTTDAFANSSTAPSTDITNLTSTTYTLNTDNRRVNATNNYVAYLFATVAGVSKVGSYTGTGTTNQINCGFTGGARFVLIKRTDSTGNWYVWDSARGIVAGNDPYLFFNSFAAEVTSTDYVDTYSAGFEISSTAPAAINANGGSFIFLAIA